MIHGVTIKDLKKFEDSRGWLAEIYRGDEIDYHPAMAYVSITKPGIARGPHEHKKQSDLFVFLGPGKFRLYLWDNRKQSPTFGEKMEIEAGEGAPKMAVVPSGVAHGYKCVSDISGWVINIPDALYAGKGRKEPVDEIRWENDPESPFKIE